VFSPSLAAVGLYSKGEGKLSDAPAVQLSDNCIIYRASALGSCIRRMVAARRGFDPKPPPAKLQAAFDEGHALEPVILNLLAERGWDLKNPQAEVEFGVGTNPQGQRLIVRGHVDAMGRPPTGGMWMPVDAKAFAQSTYDNFFATGINAFPHYSWQQSVYAHATYSRSFCLPIFNKDDGQLNVKVFHTIPHSIRDIKDRIDTIENLATSQADFSSITCPASWGCPYDYLHDHKPVETLPNELTQLVKNYIAVKRRIEAYSKARSVLADLIQSGLPQDGGTTFRGEDAIVSLVSNSKRIDTQKVKELLVEAGLDPDEYYTPGQGQHIVVKEKTT
jgi:hypothetical protein